MARISDFHGMEDIFLLLRSLRSILRPWPVGLLAQLLSSQGGWPPNGACFTNENGSSRPFERELMFSVPQCDEVLSPNNDTHQRVVNTIRCSCDY
jgi:hypothetical protein